MKINFRNTLDHKNQLISLANQRYIRAGRQQRSLYLMQARYGKVNSVDFFWPNARLKGHKVFQ